MNKPSQPHAAQIQRRVKHSTAAQIFGAGLFIIGLLFLVTPLWHLGLLCLILAIALNALRTTDHTCGACGNHVAPTSTLCPTCRITLEPPPSRTQARLLAFGILILIIIASTLVKRAIEGTL
jgi:predicted nucleic acid-binding Zn ribbon protein